jgi:hypothetical protein
MKFRELAVTLHNDHGMTNEAIRLTEALKQSFAELSDFSERIDDDVSTLRRLKQEKDKGQEQRDSIKHEKDEPEPKWKKSKLIYVLIYSVLFYISCYFMVPHGWKLLFVIGFCFVDLLCRGFRFLQKKEQPTKAFW